MYTKSTNRRAYSHSDDDIYHDKASNGDLTNINVEVWTSMGVPSAVIRALADQNFHSPTAIQAQTLPAAILGRKDIMGAAETGSGKTLAFGIPIIKGILDLKATSSRKYDSQNETWTCSDIQGNQFEFLIIVDQFIIRLII